MDFDSDLSDAPPSEAPTPGRAVTPITSPKAPSIETVAANPSKTPARKSERAKRPSARSRLSVESTPAPGPVLSQVKSTPKLKVRLKRAPKKVSCDSDIKAVTSDESANELLPERARSSLKKKARLIESDNDSESQKPPKKAVKNEKPIKKVTKTCEAKLRASIDNALNKAATKPKLNPQATAFLPRPRPPPKKSTQVQFGKTMSGWDQLFGTLSGVATPPPAKPSTPKPAAQKIRPQPILDRLDTQQLNAKRQAESDRNHDTIGTFDLLAHAEIMMAFEHEMIYQDRKMVASLRPS